MLETVPFSCVGLLGPAIGRWNCPRLTILKEGNDAGWLEFSAREFRLAQMHGPIRLTDETPSLRFSVSVGNIVARQLLAESK